MKLIKYNKMTTKEIIDFIKCKDYFYYSNSCYSDRRRDHGIFKYIEITSKNNYYKENIKLIKENGLYKLFDNSIPMIRDYFYIEILKQIDTFKDINNIFEIFPDNYIKGSLLSLINSKIMKILKDIDLKNINISYPIIDKWITFNTKDEKYGKLKEITETLKKFDHLTSNYYIYLLNKPEMKIVVEKIKHYILSFFIEQIDKDSWDEKILISVLKDFRGVFAGSGFIGVLDKKALKEGDFYAKKVTENFEFFKIFFANVNEKIIEKLDNSSYIIHSIQTQTKIIDDLKNQRVEYEKISNLFSEGNNPLDKIKVLTNSEAEKIFYNLKAQFEICDKKLKQLESIKDYYE